MIKVRDIGLCCKLLFVQGSLTRPFLEAIRWYMQQVYKRAGLNEKAVALSPSIKKIDAAHARMLIIDYGKHDNPDKAFDVLNSVLRNNLEPTLDMFNDTLHAWALSSRPYAFELANETMLLMEKNERCIALGIRPNVTSYEALLKCLFNNAKTIKKPGEVAESILQDMKSRHEAGENTQPTKNVVLLAINCCLAGRDFRRADELRMRVQ
jgi:hypothetical protein